MTQFLFGILTTVLIPWLPAFVLGVTVGVLSAVFVMWACNAMQPQPAPAKAVVRKPRQKQYVLTSFGVEYAAGLRGVA